MALKGQVFGIKGISFSPGTLHPFGPSPHSPVTFQYSKMSLVSVKWHSGFYAIVKLHTKYIHLKRRAKYAFTVTLVASLFFPIRVIFLEYVREISP